MKKYLFLFLLILTSLFILGGISILKAQENLTWHYVGYCEVHKNRINIDKCIACGEYKELSDFHAKICMKCDYDVIHCLNGGCKELKKHLIHLCWDCAAKDVCYKCGTYIGSGDIATAANRDKRKVVERYTLQITIPGKKEEFIKNYNAANEAIVKNNYQEALNYFRKCDEIIPNGCACQIGIALRGLNKEEESVKYFDIAIREEPNYAEPYYQKGLVMIGLNKFVEAETLLKKAVQFKIQEGNAYLMLAYLMESEHKDFEQAIKYYENGFGLSPATSTFRGNLVNLYQQTGKFDDALRHANILCGLLDNSVEALNVKAELFFNSQKWNDAIPIYEHLISMSPNNVHIAYYFLGLTQYQVGKYEKAHDSWVKAIELDENKNPETFSCLAICEMKLNNPEDSKKYCEETLTRMSSDNSFIYYNLACAYSLMNEKNKCLDILEKALKTGQVNLPYMESDADLANVRAAKEYMELVDKYRSGNLTQTNTAEKKKEETKEQKKEEVTVQKKETVLEEPVTILVNENFAGSDCIFGLDEKWKLINGELVFSHPLNKNTTSWVRYSKQYSDISFSVNTRWNGKEKNYGFGLLFGSRDDNFYTFLIAQDGHYKLAKYFNSEWSNPVPWKETTLRISGFNNLKICTIGKKIKCYLNNVLVVDIEDDLFNGGKIGLCCNSKVSAVFDDFIIKK